MIRHFLYYAYLNTVTHEKIFLEALDIYLETVKEFWIIRTQNSRSLFSLFTRAPSVDWILPPYSCLHKLMLVDIVFCLTLTSRFLGLFPHSGKGEYFLKEYLCYIRVMSTEQVKYRAGATLGCDYLLMFLHCFQSVHHLWTLPWPPGEQDQISSFKDIFFLPHRERCWRQSRDYHCLSVCVALASGQAWTTSTQQTLKVEAWLMSAGGKIPINTGVLLHGHCTFCHTLLWNNICHTTHEMPQCLQEKIWLFLFLSKNLC